MVWTGWVRWKGTQIGVSLDVACLVVTCGGPQDARTGESAYGKSDEVRCRAAHKRRLWVQD